MNSLQVVERAKWHNRKALSYPVLYPKDNPQQRHHARCFVLLMTWLRGGKDFEDAKGILLP